MTAPELQCFFCGRRGTRAFMELTPGSATVWCSSRRACRRRRGRILAGREGGAALLELRSLFPPAPLF